MAGIIDAFQFRYLFKLRAYAIRKWLSLMKDMFIIIYFLRIKLCDWKYSGISSKKFEFNFYLGKWNFICVHNLYYKFACNLKA